MGKTWMRIWSILALTVFCWVGVTPFMLPAAKAATVFYVAPNGNDSWSGTLDSPNGSGTDGPFRTLAKARDAMRTGSVKTTYIRAGTYYMSSTLVLSAADSGTRYRAYDGESVILSGGEPVTGFAAEANGIYAASLSAPTDMELIFDGTRQRIAEKKAYDAANLYTYGHSFAEANTAMNKVKFKAGEVTASDYVSNLKVETFAVRRWENDLLNVTSIDTANNLLNLSANVRYLISTNGTYRLLNNPAFLNETGEFAYRASDGKLLFKPADSAKLLSQGVVVPRKTVITMDGANQVVVERLTFSDTPYSLPAIDVKNGSTYNGFYNNRFLNVGKAVVFTGSSNNNVNHNEMSQIGTTGVELAYGSDYNAINWNYMHHIGLVKKSGGAVMAYGVKNNRIDHNRIEYTARYGISIKRWDTATIHTGNVVEYNKIRFTNRETQDTGAIEMLGRGANDTDTVIRYNYIEDTGGLMSDWTNPYFQYPYGADGVYLDDETSGVEVTGNFIKDNSRAAVFVHGGDNNVIRNNVGIIGRSIWKGLGHEDGKDKFVRLEWGTTQRVPSGTVLEKNIIYSKTASWPKYLDFFTGGTYSSDYNVLYQVPKISGKDVNSLVTDPLFVNISSNKYKLQAGSPAFAQGFVELPWTDWATVHSLAGIQP